MHDRRGGLPGRRPCCDATTTSLSETPPEWVRRGSKHVPTCFSLTFQRTCLSCEAVRAARTATGVAFACDSCTLRGVCCVARVSTTCRSPSSLPNTHRRLAKPPAHQVLHTKCKPCVVHCTPSASGLLPKQLFSTQRPAVGETACTPSANRALYTAHQALAVCYQNSSFQRNARRLAKPPAHQVLTVRCTLRTKR